MLRHLCFFGALLLLLHVGTNALTEDGQWIDAIISRNYQRYYQSLSESERNQLRTTNNKKNEKKDAGKLEYHCQHDSMMQKLQSKLQPFVELEGGQPQEDSFAHKPASTFLQQSVQQTFQPIRIRGDYSLLSGTADTFACYSAGASIAIGSDPSGTCTEESAGDCYFTCRSQDRQTTALQNLLKDLVMPTMIEIFAEILQVQGPSGNLLLNPDVWASFGGECNYGIQIPTSFVAGKGSGIANTDVYVFVTARPTPSDGVVAYAGACNFDWDKSANDGIFGRPLASFINFNPLHFQEFLGSTFSEFDFNAVVKVGVHEMTHALGFSSFFYKSYVDVRIDKNYRSISRTTNHQGRSPAGATYDEDTTMLITPRIVEVGRDHFQCSDLAGIELENFGGAGTAGSHWEQRVVNNELMAGYVNPLMPVSILTLAFFEDMGWYKVNYSYAQWWKWGKDQGCGFVRNRCENWPSNYLCLDSSYTSCSADRKSKSTCNIAQFGQNLPAYYQHFNNPRIGGNAPASDFCAFYDSDTSDSELYCDNVDATPNAVVGETFGADSLCWEYNVASSVLSNTPSMACWRHKCENGSLFVDIKGTWYTCPPNGGVISAVTDLSGGVVRCPSTSLACRQIPAPKGDLDTGTDEEVDSSAAPTAASTASIIVSALCLFVFGLMSV